VRRQRPGGGLPECLAWGLYPILVGCSFESDGAFKSARARCMTRVGDAWARSPDYSRRGSMIALQKSTRPIARLRTGLSQRVFVIWRKSSTLFLPW
jgi:hypothetical protein